MFCVEVALMVWCHVYVWPFGSATIWVFRRKRRRLTDFAPDTTQNMVYDGIITNRCHSPLVLSITSQRVDVNPPLCLCGLHFRV